MKKALIELATERWIELARHLRSSHQSIACSFPIAGDYIVSTDRGLFRLTKDRIRRLTVVPAFGAFSGKVESGFPSENATML